MTKITCDVRGCDNEALLKVTLPGTPYYQDGDWTWRTPDLYSDHIHKLYRFTNKFLGKAT